MIIAYLTVAICFISCAPEDEVFGEPTPTPPAKGTVAELINTSITHDWKIDNQLVTDKAIASANIRLSKDGIISEVPLSKRIDYTVSWVQPDKMRRSSPDFNFLEKMIGDKKITGTQTNGDTKITTIECSHRYDFVGLSLKFQTTNNKVEYTVLNKDGNKIVIAYAEEDSLVYKGQEKEFIETFWIDKEKYQRVKTFFNFDIYRTDYPAKAQSIQRFRTFIVTESPVNVDPGKDIFEGIIPIDGTERLYQSGPDTYTAERQVYEFWSVSGKKPTPTLLKTHYEVKQWMSDLQPAKIIPSIEVGNPKIELSSQTGQPYPKASEKDYEFEKTIATWNNTWLNGYNDKVYGSSERAWWMVNGIRIIEMPYSTHQMWFKNFIPGNGTDKNIDGKIYMNYQGVFNFNGSYNNDPFELSQNQEFNIDKSIDQKPDDNVLKSETISKKLSYSNGNGVSVITWTRDYSLTGKIDSVATQSLQHSYKLEDKKTIPRPNNILSLKDMLAPQELSHKSKTDDQTGHTIETWVRKHSFDFNFIISSVEESYQTAYTTYKNKKEDFLSDVPTVVLSGLTPSDPEAITGQDGKRYNRTTYVIKYKETYCDVATILKPEIALDVEDTTQPETDYVEDWTVTPFYDAETQVSTLKFWIKRHITGEKDSIATQKLEKIVIMEAKKQLQAPTAELIYDDVLDSEVTTDNRTENGNKISKVTTVNKFLFNHFTSKVTTKYETAYTEFMGKKIEYKVPSAPIIVYAGKTPLDLGIIKGSDGKDYKRTNYTLKYKETFNAETIPHTAEADIDVEDINVPVTRTFWEARDKGLQYISGRQYRTYFTFYEEFSDGTKKNTPVETYINVYGNAPAKRTLRFPSEEFSFLDLLPGSSRTSNRSDGSSISIVTTTTPYEALYSNKKGGNVSSSFEFISEEATYRNGDAIVEFLTGKWSISNVGYTAPFQGEIKDGIDTYRRYNASFNISGTYHDHNYPLSALIDVDVLKESEPNTPPEWGKILWDKTKLFGGGSYAWKKVGNSPAPVVTFSFIVEQGVVNITEGKIEFTKMDIARINSRVSAVLNVGGGTNNYTASTLEVLKDNQTTNSYWSYYGYDGISDLEINSVDILKIEGVSINKPFIFTPTDAGTADRYVYSDGRLLIYYQNQLVYDGTSEK